VRRFRRLGLSLLLAACLGASADIPPASSPATAAPSGDPFAPLHERQQSVRERMLQLEGRMLKLAAQLAEAEPEKSERLSDALAQTGQLRLKARLERLVELLREQRFSESEHEQQGLLTDLEALMSLLTTSSSEADRERERRRQIEAFQRQVRQLMDEQLQHLYRTKHLEKQLEPGDAGAPSAEAREMLRQLESLQRQTQQKAAQVGREMKALERPDVPAPAKGHIERAAESMRSAADRLGQQKATDAAAAEQDALDEMQQALDELDESLRQVRREEMEETLDALEARLRALLSGEREVRDQVAAVASQPSNGPTRIEQLQLSAAATQQRELEEDCEAALRILTDEGTTVVVPSLMRQLAADMNQVARRLADGDASDATRALLDQIIATLEELLAAVELKRDELTQQDQDTGDNRGQVPPLLPRSAELRLLRGAQVRINERTDSLHGAPQSEIGVAELRSLAQRQQELAGLARQIHERQ
jgi:hypothetical protein